VLINAGGFSHNEEMRKQYQPQPSTTAWTNANPGDTGEMINIAKAHGAATDLMDATIWVAGTCPPGSARPRFANMNLAKPHLILVDKQGQRFVNECVSYMELGQTMYAHGAVPAYMVFDHQHRSDYNWDMSPPGITPEAWISSGYMKRADTLEELAAMTGIDPAGLKATVARYNEFCKDGKDRDFQRGDREYDKYWADFTQKPNPTMGTIEKAPFYAVEAVPSDVGTFGGIMCDEHARVLRDDGSFIPGLYATGNCTASVMGRCYPGAGASIAAAFVFGYRAAQHATGTLPND
jgi:3-oxosteroid 1-dehydrogenase